MEHPLLQSIVEEVLQQLSEKQAPLEQHLIPIAVSARHVHVSEKDLAVLFGASYQLRIKKRLSQPNQFAAEETVTIAGPKGTIERVRVLGPVRKQTQVEVSITDAKKLGLDPPVRQSGHLNGSSPVTIIGPKGSLYLQEGLIIAQSHIHTNPADAKKFGFEDGGFVTVQVDTARPITFERVLVRVSPSYMTEMHIDTDEANTGLIQTGQPGRIIIHRQPKVIQGSPKITDFPEERSNHQVFGGKLLTDHEVQKYVGETIYIKKMSIVTPLARDTARVTGKKIVIIDA
ncbi:phosphate propanoyltransferase [Paenibacillus sp. BSR1-1]|uniref:phosphate propanoyltransferase n=1 Tax=Paenibacillus sp. BSR1-1 TaxID=3020845 RepID=UPI0025B1D371|nr:phosphate propanoyltransferase [Paenibacillus sp. BSR1-1]MDN3015849.1 phosphate propanoyltransferase [Paenibacillus sp. BSR1-1]